jgi:AraC-like DNA-binding protein
MEKDVENTIESKSEIKYERRSENVARRFFELIDKHLDELIDETAEEMFELQDVAKILGVSQKHLVKLIQESRGNHPCHFFVERIMDKAKFLLETTDWTINEIAFRLTFDPSNFTKFFKKHGGITPSEYRKSKKATSSP